MFRFSSVLLSRRSRCHSLRQLSSATSQPLELPLSYPIYLIWGSNTGVGKTLVSAGIAASTLLSPHSRFHYLKPVQTGFPSDSDSRFVFDKVTQLLHLRNPHIPLSASHSVLNASPATKNRAIANHESGEQGFGASESKKRLICKTLYAWEEAVSPHLAAEREGYVVKDSSLLETLRRCFSDVLLESGVDDKEKSQVLCVVETAGGVASPGPSGSLQCDLYRSLFIY